MTELPTETADEAERLTRLARAAIDESERQAYLDDREELLGEHGFTARVREDDTGEILVCHPSEWVEGGTIRTERIEDTDRAVERRLTGSGDPDDWETVAAHNEAIADQVADTHGEVHGANARAFADFMSNHYARRVESASAAEREEFRTEYFVRNAWPSDEQKAVVETSLSHVFETADATDGSVDESTE